MSTVDDLNDNFLFFNLKKVSVLITKVEKEGNLPCEAESMFYLINPENKLNYFRFFIKIDNCFVFRYLNG